MKAALLQIILIATMVQITPFATTAQVDASTATLKGVVTDQTGASIAGATVSVSLKERETIRTAQSTAEGAYQIPLLQPGTYQLRIEAEGFQTQIVQSLTLTVGQILVYNLRLGVSEVKSEVTISAQVPLVEVERTQQANTIERLQIASLPNLTRNFTEFVFTLPGVVSNQQAQIQAGARSAATSAPTTGISIGGSNGRSNYVTIDGGENEFGTGALRIRNYSVEAVQEYQVNRNSFNAEYGFTIGTALNVVTRSGANEFHGSGYVFYRSQKTSARDPFDFAAQKPYEQRVFPGFTFSGPIVRNKTFFFTAYEALKFDEATFRSYTGNSAALTLTAPQAAYITLLESGPNANAATLQVAAALRPALVTANYPTTLQILNESEAPFTAPSRRHNWTTRLDHQPSESDSLSGRFTFSDEENFNLSPDNTDAPSTGLHERIRDYTAVGTWAHLFGNRFVNQFRMQGVKSSSLLQAENASGTSVQITGLINYGSRLTSPLNILQKRFQVDDTLSLVLNRHNLKVGGTFRPIWYDIQAAIAVPGIWVFAAGLPLILAVSPADRGLLTGPLAPPANTTLTNVQAFNLGLPALWLQAFGSDRFSFPQKLAALFVQDSWKVTRSFTLDFGVRYEYDREAFPLGVYQDVMPRLGFAWDVFGKGHTVLRGGGGIYSAPNAIQIAITTTLQSDRGNQLYMSTTGLPDGQVAPPFLWARGVQLGKLPFTRLSEADVNSANLQTGPGKPNRRIAELGENFTNPYSIQGSLGIQQRLANNLALEVAYQVYRGVQLPFSTEGNYRESGDCALNHPQCAYGPQLVRIDPTINQKNVFSSGGNSIYHGMTASLTKRFSDGFQFQVNYTFSKTIDDVFDFSGLTVPPFPSRRYLERALSGFDVRHSFVASGIYNTPFKAGRKHNLLSNALADLTLSPIIFARSGNPFNLYIGGSVNGDSNATDRPFNMPRNAGVGPGFFGVDLRISKRIYVTGRGERGLRLDLFTEITNLLNHTNFLRVNDTIGLDPRFLNPPFRYEGSAHLPPTAPLSFTGAHSPREFQFGLKLTF